MLSYFLYLLHGNFKSFLKGNQDFRLACENKGVNYSFYLMIVVAERLINTIFISWISFSRVVVMVSE